MSIAVAIEIGVPLAQQLLSTGIGADLLAAVAAAARGCAIGDHRCAATSPEISGLGDPTRHLPDPVAQPAGAKLGAQNLLSIAAAQILPLALSRSVLDDRRGGGLHRAGHLLQGGIGREAGEHPVFIHVKN